MNKPANRCGCTHTHTHTHTVYSYQREELAEVAKVCLSYSKIAYNFAVNLTLKLICNVKEKNINNNKIYKYKEIGVV